MSAVVALHLVAILAAATLLTRELARELTFRRLAFAGPGPRIALPPWHGPVVARPTNLRARAEGSHPTPAPSARRGRVSERFPQHVAVEISTGFRVYRLPPGSAYLTREEVEVHGRCVGWCDAYSGTALPKGMTAADVAELPRATRAPAPPPLAVDVVAWCRLPDDVRQGLRTYGVTKAPGLMAFGALDPSSRRWVEHRLEEHGLTHIEHGAERDVWGVR